MLALLGDKPVNLGRSGRWARGAGLDCHGGAERANDRVELVAVRLGCKPDHDSFSEQLARKRRTLACDPFTLGLAAHQPLEFEPALAQAGPELERVVRHRTQ